MERTKLASLILIIALGSLSGVLGVQSVSLMNQNTISQSDYQQAYENWQDALANYDQASPVPPGGYHTGSALRLN